jgi:hypothetical protein
VSARRVAGVIASVVYGAGAVGLPYARVGVSAGVPDLLVGWTLLGCGIALAGRRRGSRPAMLLAASGVAWFAVDFAPLLPTGGRRVLDSTALVYLALLGHAVLVLPAGRLKGLLPRVVAAAVWGEAAAAAAGYYRVGLVAIGAAIVVACFVRWVQSPDRSSKTAVASLGAGVVLGVGVFTTALLRLTSSPPSEPALARALYIPLVVAAVLVYLAGSAMADFPIGIELVGAADGALEATIGRVLGISAVSVAFPTANGGWIGFSGESVAVDTKHVLVVRDSSTVVAALTSAGQTPADVTDPVRALLRLSGAHARLQLEMRSRLEELGRSRRRLLDAGDAERRHLEEQLRHGAIARIDRIGALLAVGVSIGPLQERLKVTRNELDGIARGIDPLANVRLAQALDEMISRCPLQVTLNVTAAEPGGRVGRAIWYTCSEALANAAKHAPDASVSISVATTSTGIVTIVADDGPGGADPRGSGLRGLADRAAALGGSVAVASGHRGTRLVLALPLASEA